MDNDAREVTDDEDETVILNDATKANEGVKVDVVTDEEMQKARVQDNNSKNQENLPKTNETVPTPNSNPNPNPNRICLGAFFFGFSENFASNRISWHSPCT